MNILNYQRPDKKFFIDNLNQGYHLEFKATCYHPHSNSFLANIT